MCYTAHIVGSINSTPTSDTNSKDSVVVERAPVTILSSLSEPMIFLALIIVGLIAIVLVKAVVSLIIPIAVAAVVWFMTYNSTYTGIAFVGVAILQLLLKRR
jgi:hypothetical protein